MQKTTFEIPKMDCPSEENLIRIKLNDISGIKNLQFDIPRRKLIVFHVGQSDRIEESIQNLNLDGKVLSTENINPISFSDDTKQRKLLWTVLSINLAFFFIEMITGLISKSMGLVADSLDMLADSLVYAISLIAVGGTTIRKKRIAKIAGYFQILLATIGLIEVLRRFLGFEEMPDYSTMIIVSAFALVANSFCLYLFQKSRNEDAHMRASMIFTSNDIIINFGVISAGVLVMWTNSTIPDLIVGTVVFLVVIYGAIRILKLGK